MKQLERLLFLQGGRCFFCQERIADGEASVEHLVAVANGGAKDDENCVACCKAINAALGSLSIKAKLQALLNHRGMLVCPQVRIESDTPTRDGEPKETSLAMVVSDLQKRGPARPRKVATLRNTINSVFQNTLTDDALTLLIRLLESRGYISVTESKVSYTLPS